MDDTGASYGSLTLSVDAGETARFNSDALEAGNAAKGRPAARARVGRTGTGSVERLDLEVLSYIRTVDGFLTAMHDRCKETCTASRSSTPAATTGR